MSNLALDLRPQSLDAVIGQDSAKRAIKSFAEKDNWPNVFLLVGLPGTGKTTLAEIIVRMVGSDSSCIHQINGSDKNGVEDARELAEISASSPLTGQRRAFIINECQRLTPQAQDVLLEPMEKSPALWILTSTDPGKLIPAIKSRASAATFNLLPLNDAQIKKFISQFDDLDIEKAVAFLSKNNIRAPREILGVLDQHFAGLAFEDCSFGDENEPLYTEVSAAVLAGNWAKTANLLKQIKTADYRAMVAVVSAKLSWALLDSDFSPRADAIAICLVGLGVNQFADGVAYSSLKALLYKCTKALGAK